MRAHRHPLLLVVIGLLIATLIAAVTLAVLRASSFERWLHRDAGQLRPYDLVLVEDGAEIEPAGPGSFDRALVDHISRGREVAGISRSDIRHALVGGRAWTKVHLVTSKPGEPTVRIQIKMLVEMEEGRDGWHVTEERTLAIP